MMFRIFNDPIIQTAVVLHSNVLFHKQFPSNRYDGKGSNSYAFFFLLSIATTGNGCEMLCFLYSYTGIMGFTVMHSLGNEWKCVLGLLGHKHRIFAHVFWDQHTYLFVFTLFLPLIHFGSCSSMYNPICIYINDIKYKYEAAHW